MTSGPLPRPQIMLIEDNDGDQLLTRKALEAWGIGHDLHIMQDGEEALDYLNRNKKGAFGTKRPHLILLDLNLPRVDGFEVLETLKTDPELRQIPVIVLTSSSAESDLIGAYTRHANAYMVKPGSPQDFESAMKSLGVFWFVHNRLT